jgi:spore germination cell wall hydrolase CwlJ-like protein
MAAKMDKNVNNSQQQALDPSQFAARRDQYLTMADNIEQGKVTPTGVDGNSNEDYRALANKRAQTTSLTEAQTSQNVDFAKGSVDFFRNYYPAANANLDAIAKLSNAYETNYISPELARYIGTLRSIPGLGSMIPESLKSLQGAVDTEHKMALLDAMQAIQSFNAQKAPAAMMGQATQTVADPTLSPEARREIVVRTKANLNYNADMFKAWEQQGRPDVPKFVASWATDPTHQLENYVKNAESQVPTFAGQASLVTQPKSAKPGVQQWVPPSFNAPPGTQFNPKTGAYRTPDGKILDKNGVEIKKSGTNG